MDEKKIVFKSIDEQLAEDERREAAKAAASRKSPERVVEKAATGTKNATGPKRGRKKLRLKKSVRRTIGSLMLATSIVVAAIPVGGVSADSTGVYKGSTAKAPDLDKISPKNAGEYDIEPAKHTKVKNIDSTKCLGGWPIQQDGDQYVSKKILGKDYWIVNTTGYSVPRPIYAIDNTDTYYIDKFIETVGEDTYAVPGGKVNLSQGAIGYVRDSFTEDVDSKVIYSGAVDGRYYKIEVIKYSIAGYTLFGKKISIYDQKTVEKCTVSFYDANKQLITTREVVKGQEMADGTVPDVPQYQGKDGYWRPDVKDHYVINSDLSVFATYDESNPKAPALAPESEMTPEEDSGLNNASPDSELGLEDDHSDAGEDSSIEEGAGEENTSVDDSAGESGEESEDSSANEISNESENTSAVPSVENIVIEDHPDEINNAGFGLDGVVLFWDPNHNPHEPEDIEWWDDPTEEYYVCEYTANTTQICDGAFEGTTQISSVDFSTNIQKIGNKAFADSFVKNITLGTVLNSIGASAFEHCTKLQNVNYDPDQGVQLEIGAKAFANNESFTTFAPSGQSGFIIPPTVNKIGDAAFYEDRMTSIDFSKAGSIDMGNFAFARCHKLETVDLSNDTETLTISNLSAVDRLFAQCEILHEVIMPDGFNGTLPAGTFGSCEKMNHIIFKDGGGTFTNGEFDKWQITVEGPKPSKGGNYLNPTGNTSASYTSSLDSTNDYVYRYLDADGQHEVANQPAYTPSANFFKADKSTLAKERNIIFDIKEPSTFPDVNANNPTLLVAYYDSVPTTVVDLEIGGKIGQRNDGDIPIVEIKNDVFKDNTSIQKLQLDSTINHVHDSAFEHTQIIELWANVYGTEFHNKAFYNNPEMTRATFAYSTSTPYSGNEGSSLGSSCFAKTPKLDNVDFYDDNLTTGVVGQAAVFKYDSATQTSSISSDAFITQGRTREITFKGPMQKDYAPYEFAINKNSLISELDTLHVVYYSGNPWNLTAQYRIAGDAFSKVPPTNAEQKKKLDPVEYEGVCLLKYPNMSSRVENDDIDEQVGKTVTDLSNQATVTPMENQTIFYTHNISVPYGIDYIDIAQTYVPGNKYYTFNDDTNNYTEKTDAFYHIFKYNPDILSVTFEDGGVDEFPDRMFEGAINLESVTFAGDVTNIGKLPFYLPDTEVWNEAYDDSFSHNGPKGPSANKEFRSHLSSISFLNEGTTAEILNERYFMSADSDGVINGIIKGDNGKRINVVQISPSKGAPIDIDLPDGGTYFGTENISSDELADVNRFDDYAARDCDAIKTVDFSKNGCDISKGCFMDCDRLYSFTMPNKWINVNDLAFTGCSKHIDVTFPYNEVTINDLPWKPLSSDGRQFPDVTFHVHKDAEALQGYADEHANIDWERIPDQIKIEYFDRYDNTYYECVMTKIDDPYPKGQNYKPSKWPEHEGTLASGWEGRSGEQIVDWENDVLTDDTKFTSVYKSSDEVTVYWIDGYNNNTIKKKTVTVGADLVNLYPNPPTHTGYHFTNWSPYLEEAEEEGEENNKIIALYESDNPTPTPTPTVTPTPTTSPSPSSSSTSRSSSSSSSKSSSSSSSGSSSSSAAYPVYVNSQDGYAGGSGMPITGEGSTVYVDDGSSGGSGSGSGSGKKGSGNASVISTTGGITDTGKISATVNGSSDNYVIKITQTQEADEMGLAALHNKYGEDISPIRYLPFDISLYDSTGTNKISPVPEGVSVTITMPIPDDLAIYGGNAKIACTTGGVLDVMTPRFTVISGVPCMTFTCTHFSPYMIWVDTANLTEAGISDMTPKTADGIHPKWFLCFGLAAIAVVMFLKKDPEEYLRKAA